MDETSRRLTEPGVPPSQAQVEAWLGEEAYGYWNKVADLISRKYPGVFSPEWLLGRKEHGWSLG